MIQRQIGMLLALLLFAGGCAADLAPEGNGETEAPDVSDASSDAFALDVRENTSDTDAGGSPTDTGSPSTDADDLDTTAEDTSSDASPDVCADCSCDSSICTTGQICVDKACVDEGLQCPEGMVPCGEVCIDIDSNPTHCGACDRPCGGRTISQGCQGGNVVMTEQQPVCAAATCGTNAVQTVVEDCNFGCSGGSCNPPECGSNGDCGSITYERVQSFSCRAIDGATADANFEFTIPRCNSGRCSNDKVTYNLACRCDQEICDNGVCDRVSQSRTGCETRAHNGQDVSCPTNDVKNACL